MKIDEPHLRRCFDCGTTNEHQSRIVPGVLCPRCGSQDTRHIPTRTKPMTVAELLAHEGDSPTELAMQAAIRDLVARVEASQLTWTDEKPTVPGWYWFKGPYQKSVKAIEIRALCDEDDELVIGHPIRYMPLATCSGQFAGPIPPPADTREGDAAL